MSLILDALNRSRRDADPVPGIDTQHAVAPPPSVGASVVRGIAPWLALALALLVITYLLLERKDEVSSPPVVASVSDNLGSALNAVSEELRAKNSGADTAMAPLGAPPLASTRQPAATQTQPKASVPPAVAASDAAPDAAIAQLYQQSQSGELPQPEVAEPTLRAASSDNSQPQRAAPASVEPAAAQQAASQEDPVDLETLLVAAREEMQNSQLVEHPAPFLSTLSQQVKNDIPTILYQRHDYATDIARSSVLINSKVMRPGSNQGGFKVDEILPDSVVLTYRDTQFRLRALNSWVNL